MSDSEDLAFPDKVVQETPEIDKEEEEKKEDSSRDSGEAEPEKEEEEPLQQPSSEWLEVGEKKSTPQKPEKTTNTKASEDKEKEKAPPTENLAAKDNPSEASPKTHKKEAAAASEVVATPPKVGAKRKLSDDGEAAASNKKQKTTQKKSTTPSAGKKEGKRPSTPYGFFAQVRRKEIQAKEPSMKGPKITQAMKKEWDDMSDDDKKPYNAMAEKEKDQKESSKTKEDGKSKVSAKPKHETTEEPKPTKKRKDPPASKKTGNSAKKQKTAETKPKQPTSKSGAKKTSPKTDKSTKDKTEEPKTPKTDKKTKKTPPAKSSKSAEKSKTTPKKTSAETKAPQQKTSKKTSADTKPSKSEAKTKEKTPTKEGKSKSNSKASPAKETTTPKPKAPPKTDYLNVLAASSLTPKQKLVLEQESTKGDSEDITAQYFEHISKHTTHLIVGAQKRTGKVLEAIAQGIWVVGYKWFSDSKKTNKWIDETAYEQASWFPGCKLSRLAKQSNDPAKLLFYKTNFLLNLKDEKSKKLVTSLITQCGGKIVGTSEMSDYVICDNVIEEESQENLKQPVVNTAWLFDALTTYKRPSPHKAEYKVEGNRSKK